MVRRVPAGMYATWQNGDFVGDNRPICRATIQTPYNYLFTQDQSLYASMLFWDSKSVRDETASSLGSTGLFPVELPNIKAVQWTRSIDQDVASCTLTLYNTKPLPVGTAPPEEYAAELDALGYYTYTQRNEWTGMLVPDRIIRTYEGYGWTEGTIPERDPKLMITGTWMIDTVAYTADGMITVTCRDLGRILLDQVVFPPICPPNRYPLAFSARQQVDAGKKPINPRLAWNGPVHIYGEGRNTWDTTAPPVREAGPLIPLKYDTCSATAVGAPSTQYGHKPQHSLDSNEATYWLSEGFDAPMKPYSYAWIQYGMPKSTLDRVIFKAPARKVDSFTLPGGGRQVQKGTQVVFLSVYADGRWQGHQRIDYDPVEPFGYGGGGSGVNPRSSNYYTVRSGDYLIKIAGIFGIVDWYNDLYVPNRATIGADPNRIYPGQRLVLPYYVGRNAQAGAIFEAMPNLATGATNADAVEVLQQALNLVTGSSLAVDGVYGASTANVVRNVQGFFGLPSTGTVTRAIWDVLDFSLAYHGTDMPGFPRDHVGIFDNEAQVGQGSTGSSVSTAQTALNILDGAGLTVDGSFGPATRTAVINFQRFFGLHTDGIVGPITWHVMDVQFSQRSLSFPGRPRPSGSPAGPVRPPTKHPDNGADIPYVGFFWMAMDEQYVNLELFTPIDRVEKIRLTFWNLGREPNAAVPFRAALREVYARTVYDPRHPTPLPPAVSGSPGTGVAIVPGTHLETTLVPTYYYVGNYGDYTDIVKLFCAWAGFYWPAGAKMPLSDGTWVDFPIPGGVGDTSLVFVPDDVQKKQIFYRTPEGVEDLYNLSQDKQYGYGTPRAYAGSGRVWGDFLMSGTTAVTLPVSVGESQADLPIDVWDKKPLMDGINYVRDILGFIFFIDETGAPVWRLPNIFKLGNIIMDPPGFDVVDPAKPPFSPDGGTSGSFMYSIDENKVIMGLTGTLDGQNLRERVFIATADGRYGAAVRGFNPYPVGLRRVGGWTDQNFASDKECLRMAQMIALRQMMSYRSDQVQIPGFPGIQIDDQVEISEKVTGDYGVSAPGTTKRKGLVHYIKGISSNMDMEQGDYTYSLTTQWLGISPETLWVFNPNDLLPETKEYLAAITQGLNFQDTAAAVNKWGQDDSHTSASWGQTTSHTTSTGWGTR